MTDKLLLFSSLFSPAGASYILSTRERKCHQGDSAGMEREMAVLQAELWAAFLKDGSLGMMGDSSYMKFHAYGLI